MLYLNYNTGRRISANGRSLANTLEDLIQRNPLITSIDLIGHSMGCTAIAHWAKKYQKVIKGALLVAPSDLEAPFYSFPATGFTPIPQEKFNFRTIVVASENDEWVSPDRARFFAANWGSDFMSLGKAGHINVTSGHGVWDEGLVILKKLD